MTIKFTEEALEAIFPPCFGGDHKEAATMLGPILVDRADGDGYTYASIAGKIIDLRLREITGVTYVTYSRPRKPK